MSEFTPLREAVDTLASDRPSPDFGELERRATRRGRRRIAMVSAVTAAVIVGSVLAVTHVDVHRRVAPIKPPAPVPTAEQIIADGHLYDYDATASGAVLTVWTTCQNELDTHCGHAWRLGTGRRPLATGIVALNTTHAYVQVNAGDGAFLLTHGRDPSLRVAVDGTVTSLTYADCRPANPPLKPGRLVWNWGGAFDLAGVYCPTSLGTGDRPDPSLNGQTLAGSAAAFTADGRLWALVNNEAQSDRRQTIGTFDGSRWRYHNLAARGDASASEIAAVGSTVVVLGRSGISVTTDDGGTWHEVTDPDALAGRLPFLSIPGSGCCLMSMALAGPSTMYVSDGVGGLWRSTDLATFRRVETPSKVTDLKSSGDEAFARVASGEDLVRIAANGRVERLTAR